MMKMLKKYFADENGSTAVEFGAVSLAFLLVLFGVFESGRMFIAWNSFQYALENAGRYALVNEDATEQEIQAFLADEMGNYPTNGDGMTVNVAYTTSSGIDFIEITGTYNFTTVASALLPDGWGSRTLNASTRQPVP